jgi:transposase
MRLHGNAALSWSGRRRLAERVVIEGWTLKAAAEAADVSVRCARKWVGRYRREGELHPHPARRLGLRRHLPLKPGTRTCP